MLSIVTAGADLNKQLKHRLFISGLDTEKFCLFFFTAHSRCEYVQSNQSNTRDRKKPSQQEQIFFQSSSLFLRGSVSSLLNEESMVER